jgi:hypothetical protein
VPSLARTPARVDWRLGGTAALPRDADVGPVAVGVMSKSKISVGRASVAQALGMSTWRSIQQPAISMAPQKEISPLPWRSARLPSRGCRLGRRREVDPRPRERFLMSQLRPCSRAESVRAPSGYAVEGRARQLPGESILGVLTSTGIRVFGIGNPSPAELKTTVLLQSSRRRSLSLRRQIFSRTPSFRVGVLRLAEAHRMRLAPTIAAATDPVNKE